MNQTTTNFKIYKPALRELCLLYCDVQFKRRPYMGTGGTVQTQLITSEETGRARFFDDDAALAGPCSGAWGGV